MRVRAKLISDDKDGEHGVAGTVYAIRDREQVYLDSLTDLRLGDQLLLLDCSIVNYLRTPEITIIDVVGEHAAIKIFASELEYLLTEIE